VVSYGLTSVLRDRILLEEIEVGLTIEYNATYRLDKCIRAGQFNGYVYRRTDGRCYWGQSAGSRNDITIALA
jgi:hypothetical protein